MKLRQTWGMLGQALFVVLFAASSQAFWAPDGSYLNAQGNTLDATQPSVAVGTDGTVWAAWIEASIGAPQLFVKRYNGAAWESRPQALASVNSNPGYDVQGPSLDLDVSVTPNVPYLAYCESTGGPAYDILVKFWNGTSWQQLGTRLNAQTASLPHLRINASNSIHVVWQETQGGVDLIFAKKWNAGSWEWVFDSAPLNRVASRYATGPRLSFGSDGSPYVAWVEDRAPGFYNVYVSHLDAGWSSLGDTLNLNPTLHAYMPDVVVLRESLGGGPVRDVPYVVWAEMPPTGPRALPAKRWNGTAWELLSTTLQADRISGFADRPRLARADLFGTSTVYLAWGETQATSTNYLRHWTGSDWPQDNGSMGDPTHTLFAPDLAARNSPPYAAFTDNLWVDAVGNSRTLLYVQHWVAPTATPTPTSQPTPVVTPTPPPPAPDEVYVYPVPASSQATFAFNAPGNTGAVEVLVYNTHFRLVKRLTGDTDTGRGTLDWNTSEVPPGIYFYQVRVGGKRWGTQKLVVAR
jgi:hypothetical protein